MPKGRKVRNRRQFPWLIIVCLVIVGAVVVIFNKSRSPVTYDCSMLPINELFEGYPESSKIKNLQEWQTKHSSDPEERMKIIDSLLLNNGGAATTKLGKWLGSIKVNRRFVPNLVAGRYAMATGFEKDSSVLWVEIGERVLREKLNPEVALLYSHEVGVHYYNSLHGYKHGENPLCEEMEAYAYEVWLYAEFREYWQHPTYEEEYALLAEKLHWQWQSKEWADYISPCVAPESYR